MRTTGIGGSLTLLALGAILFFAVTVETSGFNINTAGIIMMIVGAIGLFVTMAMGTTREHTVVEKDRSVVVDS